MTCCELWPGACRTEAPVLRYSMAGSTSHKGRHMQFANQGPGQWPDSTDEQYGQALWYGPELPAPVHGELMTWALLARHQAKLVLRHFASGLVVGPPGGLN